MIIMATVTIVSVSIIAFLGYKYKVVVNKNKDITVKYESVKTYAEQFAAKATQPKTAKTTASKRGRKPKKA